MSKGDFRRKKVLEKRNERAVLKQIKSIQVSLTPEQKRVSAELESYLRKLRVAFGLGGKVTKVVWIPKINITLDGQKFLGCVDSDEGIIYVCGTTKDEALSTFFHEYVEHIIKPDFTFPYATLAEKLGIALEKLTLQKFPNTNRKALKTIVKPILEAFQESKYLDQERVIDSIARVLQAFFTGKSSLEFAKIARMIGRELNN